MDYIKEIKAEKTDESLITAFEIMASGKVDSIVPVSITDSGSYMTASYNLSELTLLKDAVSGTGADVRIKMISMVLDSIENNKDHLLFPDRCILTIDNIYVTRDCKKVKIMYIPFFSSETENDLVLKLINEILDSEDMKEIRESISSYIVLHNPKPLRLKRYIENINIGIP